MSGNHLFRNRKRLASEHSQSSEDDLAQTFGELNEQVIRLRKEDVHTDAPAAPVLDWSTVEKGEIAVQLKDTAGLVVRPITAEPERVPECAHAEGHNVDFMGLAPDVPEFGPPLGEPIRTLRFWHQNGRDSQDRTMEPGGAHAFCPPTIAGISFASNG